MRSAWDKNGVEARLDHFRKKAAAVRELRIIDHGPQMWCHPESGGEDEPAVPFDSTLVPGLMQILKPPRPSTIFSPSFSKVPKHSPRSTQLPEELWRWMARVRPEVFFDGYLAFRRSLGCLPSVRFMSIFAGNECPRILEVGYMPSGLSLGDEADTQRVLRPARLDLSIDIKVRLRGAFKEICEPYPSLQQLDVRFQHYDNDSVPPGYFDLTSHPETRIVIHITAKNLYELIETPVSVIWIL